VPNLAYSLVPWLAYFVEFFLAYSVMHLFAFPHTRLGSRPTNQISPHLLILPLQHSPVELLGFIRYAGPSAQVYSNGHGILGIHLDENTNQIHWYCNICGDEGVVTGWKGLIWNMLDRPVEVH
jgi:hypothetical protein